MVFVMDVECVLCEVGAKFLYTFYTNIFKGLKVYFSVEMCFSFDCDPKDVFDTESDPPKDRPTDRPTEQLTVRRTERPSIVSTVNLSLERFME